MLVKQAFVFTSLIILFFLFSTQSKSFAADARKAEMYLGDYEISANKVGSVYTYEEVKYIETGSAKVIKKRTSTTNTWVSSYYHTNHQGSTSVVTANNGRKDTEFSSGRLRYFPYGEQITKQNVNNLVVDDSYTGQKKDTETDLMFYNARLYNHNTGLFMQADSVNDGLNRYMYVGGNPVIKVDPSGQFANFIIGAIIGGAVDLVSQVGIGMIEGKSFSESVQDVNWVSVGASTVLGAATSGASAVTAIAAKTIGKTAATVLVHGALAAGEVGATIVADLSVNNGERPKDEVAKEAAVRGVVNVVGFGVAGHIFGKVASAGGDIIQKFSVNLDAYKFGSEAGKLRQYGVNSFGEAYKSFDRILDLPEGFVTQLNNVSRSPTSRHLIEFQDFMLGDVQRRGYSVTQGPLQNYAAGVNKEARTFKYDVSQFDTLADQVSTIAHEYGHVLAKRSRIPTSEFEASILGSVVGRNTGARKIYEANRALWHHVVGKQNPY